MSIQESHTFW